MKLRKVDVFERNGHELFNLALKLDSNSKLEDAGDHLERSPLSRARHDTIVALGALIRAVAVLLRN